MNGIVEVNKGAYINPAHVVTASDSLGYKDVDKFIHENHIGKFRHKEKCVIFFKMIDGSIVSSAGIGEYDSSYYANAWEALNPGLKFAI